MYFQFSVDVVPIENVYQYLLDDSCWENNGTIQVGQQFLFYCQFFVNEMYAGECRIESRHKSQLPQYILMIYWRRLQWLKWLERLTYMNEFKSIYTYRNAVNCDCDQREGSYKIIKLHFSKYQHHFVGETFSGKASEETLSLP